MNTRRVVIVSLALALVFVLVTARHTAMDVFFHDVEVAPPDTTRRIDAGSPQSIIAINIDPETNATGTIDVTPPPPPPPPPPTRTDTTTVRPERPDSTDLDVDDLLAGEAAPREGQQPAPVPAAIPPRPIEITWPETRQLKQCIGQSVNVRIWVSEKGTVKDVKVAGDGMLPACAEAALAAARHIRFEPGRQGGVPVTMWTEVRIDFQKRD
jgi:TonB family protein